MTRPPIPNDIKRKVRQKSKFGCLVCGCPICDYDHLINEWADIETHNVDDIYLLCPNHHREKTKGTLTKEIILELFNSRKSSHTTPHPLNFETLKLVVGNNTIESFNGKLISILEKDFFEIRIEDNELLINEEFYNQDGEAIFTIEDNLYKCHIENVWDFEFVGKTITIRSKAYDINLKLTLDAANNQIKLLGKIYLDKEKYLNIKDTGIFFNTICLLDDCFIGKSNEYGIRVLDNIDSIKGSIGFSKCKGVYGGGMVGNFSFAAANTIEVHKCTVSEAKTGFAWSRDFFKELKE